MFNQEDTPARDAKGRHGWWNPDCTDSSLINLMQSAIDDQNWVSVANYAGMLAFREEHFNEPANWPATKPTTVA